MASFVSLSPYPMVQKIPLRRRFRTGANDTSTNATDLSSRRRESPSLWSVRDALSAISPNSRNTGSAGKEY